MAVQSRFLDVLFKSYRDIQRAKAEYESYVRAFMDNRIRETNVLTKDLLSELVGKIVGFTIAILKYKIFMLNNYAMYIQKENRG